MISIATYGICQEMHMNGPQNTLPTLSLASCALVLLVEVFTAQSIAKPTFLRLTVTTIARLSVPAVLVYVPCFM